MSWKRLLAERRVERRDATKEEIADLRSAVERKLRHAELAKSAGFAAEERFSLAYDAARLSAVLAVRAAGYRVLMPAAHYNTFVALGEAMGPSLAEQVA